VVNVSCVICSISARPKGGQINHKNQTTQVKRRSKGGWKEVKVGGGTLSWAKKTRKQLNVTLTKGGRIWDQKSGAKKGVELWVTYCVRGDRA